MYLKKSIKDFECEILGFNKDPNKYEILWNFYAQ